MSTKVQFDVDKLDVADFNAVDDSYDTEKANTIHALENWNKLKEEADPGVAWHWSEGKSRR